MYQLAPLRSSTYVHLSWNKRTAVGKMVLCLILLFCSLLAGFSMKIQGIFIKYIYDLTPGQIWVC